jgi:hypothetical protein
MDKNKLFLAVLSWLFTFVIAALVLYPIWSKVTVFPENINIYNFAYIILAVTLTRYIFLLPYTYIAENQKIKGFLIALSVPVIIFCINGIFAFRQLVDNDGYEVICQGVVAEQVNSIGQYYRNEYIFFGVAATIAAIVFPIRLVISIWRKINKGTV